MSVNHEHVFKIDDILKLFSTRNWQFLQFHCVNHQNCVFFFLSVTFAPVSTRKVIINIFIGGTGKQKSELIGSMIFWIFLNKSFFSFLFVVYLGRNVSCCSAAQISGGYPRNRWWKICGKSWAKKNGWKKNLLTNAPPPLLVSLVANFFFVLPGGWNFTGGEVLKSSFVLNFSSLFFSFLCSIHLVCVHIMFAGERERER